MKTKIINFLQKIKTLDLKKTWIITIFIIAGIIAGATIYNQHNQIQQAKAELLEKTLTDDQKKLVDIEKKKKTNIDSLNTLKDEISERIKKQEMIEKLQVCYDQQVNRILNWQETNDGYCEELVQEEKKRNTTQTGKIETVSKKQPELQNLDKNTFDIDKLAKAVAMHETADCKKWTWIKYDNCFWIRNGNTAPCKKTSAWGFCIYDTPSESYKAFKKIWSKNYGWLPTLQMAKRWSWNDRPEEWKNNVLHFYNLK